MEKRRTRRKPPEVTVETPIGADVDLSKKAVRLKSGKRLTPKVAEEIIAASRGGRPSLTGRAQHSPQIAFRVTPEVRERAYELAKKRNVPVSQLAREALEEKLRRVG